MLFKLLLISIVSLCFAQQLEISKYFGKKDLLNPNYLTIDSFDNIYIGNASKIIKYDVNGNYLASYFIENVDKIFIHPTLNIMYACFNYKNFSAIAANGSFLRLSFTHSGSCKSATISNNGIITVVQSYKMDEMILFYNTSLVKEMYMKTKYIYYGDYWAFIYRMRYFSEYEIWAMIYYKSIFGRYEIYRYCKFSAYGSDNVLCYEMFYIRFKCKDFYDFDIDKKK